ncbi:family 16 glycoside hydrolase [Pedobacter gandavensis]|uniref:family 16 glycoside hydrolase n=1 Tax=Pedobacter gandavensis TaxID=2679963 RepID=UPI00292FE32B|nr:family 16 glycoside hydrolase [Pedobacter gandavensis]
MKKICFILLAGLAFQGTLHAQDKKDQRTQTTRIADLLAQMPAKDAGLGAINVNEIAALGENGYLELIGMLSPVGKGNNAPIEYAIGGFTAASTKSGHENWRKMSVAALGKALQKLTDPQNKAFIMSQLDGIAKDDAIPYLISYLKDAQLADPSVRVLVKINTPAAQQALLAALASTLGKSRLSVVEGLGDSRVKAAAQPIGALTVGTDPNLTKMSLYALAKIADPSSEGLMASAAAKSNFKYENTNAVPAYLDYAANLLLQGNSALSHKIALQLLDKANGPDLVSVRTGALKILADEHKAADISVLLAAMKDPSVAYRAAALKFALPYLNPGTTALWISQLTKEKPDVQAEMVTMLGDGKAKAALPTVLKLINAKDEALRFAAIEAAANIGGSEVLDDLFKTMAKGDEATINKVADVLLRMKGEDLTGKIADVLPKMKPNVQVALIQVLASRSAHGQINTVYALQKSKNPAVRKAAFAALPSLATKADLSDLFSLLNSKEISDEESLMLQSALIAALKGASTENDTALVLEKMAAASPEKKKFFYKVLASLGNAQSLAAVNNAFQTGDEQTKKVALEALASWANEGSLESLLAIARTNGNPDFQQEALKGYLRLLRASRSTPAQRLLRLRDAMDVAKTEQLQQQILTDLQDAKTYNAAIFAGRYMDQPALQQAAARAVMMIVLSDRSYEGAEVRDLLNKTIQVLKGGDSEYEKEAVRKYLAEMKAGTGFVSVFNGKDLTGWKGLVADPLKRAKMDDKTLAAAQEKADAAALKSWVIEKGDLLFTGNGDNLATLKKYGDFEMLVDWKIYDDGNKKGDAGIYLRGSPQVQIWDTSRVDVGAQVGSGGLYNNQVNESKPLKVVDNKLGEWNTFRIIMKGDRVTVYLNGVLVTDDVILENYWDRKLPIFAEEQIELQAHGSRVAYRDIYIKELERPVPFQLSAAEKKEGYKVLFDGTNMHEWTGNTAAYTISDGNMEINPKPGKGSGGNLFSKDDYSDFVFRFEFQLTPGANNGLGIRAPLAGDAAYEGMELQILDNDAPIYKDLHVYQYHGSIYGVQAAKRGSLKPLGEWNYQEVTVKGPKIKVVLNGDVILDGDITEARKKGTVDGQNHPGLQRDKGRVGFLGHGSVVRFKNIRIKDLSTSK